MKSGSFKGNGTHELFFDKQHINVCVCVCVLYGIT